MSSTPEGFGDNLESLYNDAVRIEQGTKPKTPVPSGSTTRRTSFLDLPGEIRNEIYSLALPKSGGRPIDIDFQYDLELLEEPQTRRNFLHEPRRHRNWNWNHAALFRSEIGSFYWTRIVECTPPLAIALPKLQREVLEVWYAENSFTISFWNCIERQLFTQWVKQKGSLLRDIPHVKVRMPFVVLGSQYAFVFHVRLPSKKSGNAVITVDPSLDYRNRHDCSCSFASLVHTRFDQMGWHADARYEAARKLDAEVNVGPVVRKVLEACSVAEWMDDDLEEIIKNGDAHRLSKRREKWPVHRLDGLFCEICGKRRKFVL